MDKSGEKWWKNIAFPLNLNINSGLILRRCF